MLSIAQLPERVNHRYGSTKRRFDLVHSADLS